VRELARTAARAVSRHDLIQEAVQFLLANSKADRVGIWMDGADAERMPGCAFAGFRGMVADRDGEAPPPEWQKLSPESPLPVERMQGAKSVEQHLDGASDQMILGVLLEMRRAVWVPVEIRGRLRGVLLAGLRRKRGGLPVQLLEAVSAELALAVELDEERQSAHDRQADLALTKEFIDELARVGPTDALLARLIENCIGGSAGDGLGAVFAALRPCSSATESSRHQPSHANSQAPESHSELLAQVAERPEPSLQSGDLAWLQSLDNPPLAGILQRAREGQCTITVRTGAGTAWPRGDVARLAVIGLEAAGETLGVLAAGFRHESPSRAVIGRLELRAGLAITALVLRERNREAARQQASQRALLQGSDAATLLVDGRGAIVGLSRGARALLGDEQDSTAPAGEEGATPSRQFVELFHARARQQVENWLRRVRAHAHLEIGNHHDAREVELQSGGRVLLQCVQPHLGLAVVILEPLAAPDTALRQDRAEAQLFHLMEWLEEGVVLFDAQNRIQAMNSRFEQMFGMPAEESGRIATLHGLIARLSDQAAEPEKFAKRWRDLGGGLGSGLREEILLARPAQRVLERVARPILDADGRPIGRVEIYRDLTAQRAFQAKLLQTERLAALGQMVTGIAHELSNPLTSILGYAQRLFLRSHAEGQSDEVQQIFQEAERASAIVRQLLMNARESLPERRKVSLNQLVSRTVDLQKITLAGEKVAVELDLDETLPFIIGDAGQLQQVVLNLVGNARQAIEQRGRGGTIRLSTKGVDSGQRAQLEVSDDGPGVPQAIASRIFDPFFTTKPAGIGTGLGLAIVLGVVREHGGHVRVASPPGGGATFSVQFPAAPMAQAQTGAVPATGPGRKLAPGWQQRVRAALSSGNDARVLVVEDEPTVARLISDVLEDEGFQVDTLVDGHEALERVAKESYDLVVCDMRMPGLDGQHFYETLASAGNPLCKRFLFVTGDVLSSPTHEFLNRHNLPHVAKPFRVEELTERVRRVLLEVQPGEHAEERASKPAPRTNVART
jgi:signal transduction histidine kinase/FixJ family two-component response regulator